jgi:hypothetical protein
MFKDFDKRLRVEIKRMVDERTNRTIEMNKNNLIVCFNDF